MLGQHIGLVLDDLGFAARDNHTKVGSSVVIDDRPKHYKKSLQFGLQRQEYAQRVAIGEVA